jgi:hypothetical protein
MKKLLVVLAVLAFPVSAMCSPFLVCDTPPAGTVTHYKITGDTFWTGNVTAQPDGSIRSDVATIPVGTHNISVVACRTASGWPETCSTPVSFLFTRPVAPTAPAGVGLAP